MATTIVHQLPRHVRERRSVGLIGNDPSQATPSPEDIAILKAKFDEIEARKRRR